MARNPETDLQNEILLAIGSRPDTLAWRQTVGAFRAMDNPSRIVRVGVPGMSDVMSVVAVTVTPRMVGAVVPVAVAHEIKTATGKQREAQKLWQKAFEERGGIYLISRSPEDSLRAITGVSEIIAARS